MKKEDWYATQRDLVEEMVTLTRQKNDDYTAGADDAFANFRLAEEVGVDALHGLVIRMADKWQRIKAYFNNGELVVEGEGLEDAFKDMIGYSAIAIAMLKEKQQ